MQLLQVNIGNLEIWQWLFMVAVVIPMSVKDLKEKKINGYFVVLAVMTALVFRVTYLKENDFVILLDILPGLVLLLVSFLSKEEIGYGDGLMLVFIGCVMGFGKTILALMISLTVTMIVALILTTGGGKSRKREIPFVPFMFMGAFAGGLL